MLGGESIKVAVRVRPLLHAERAEGHQNCIREAMNHIILGGSRSFAFDTVYNPSVHSDTIFDAMVMPLLSSFSTGMNATFFAYGQTGTGKTFTVDHVMARAAEWIFNECRHTVSDIQSIELSVLEVYNDRLTDLLEPSTPQLQLREDSTQGLVVTGLTRIPLTDLNEWQAAVSEGQKLRSTASTLLNTSSSRSHLIATVYLTTQTTISKIHFVDLAGSERMKKAHGQDGSKVRVQEGIKINSGLLALGNVIEALCAKRSHIPFRSSKLTRLLQDSLSGNSLTAMIACVSPSDRHFEESLSTLKYAHRAKNIQTAPTVNLRDPEETPLVQELRAQIRCLSADLENRGLGGSTAASIASSPTYAAGGEAHRNQTSSRVAQLEEELRVERRLNSQLEADLFRSECAAADYLEELTEARRKLENFAASSELFQQHQQQQQVAAAVGSPKGTMDFATTGSRATSVTVDEISSSFATQDALAARQLEEERDTLLSEKLRVEGELERLTSQERSQQTAEMEAEVSSKKKLLDEMLQRERDFHSIMGELEDKLGSVEVERRKLAKELAVAEDRLEKSNMEREAKERQRLQLQQSFEARMKAAEISITQYRRKLKEQQAASSHAKWKTQIEQVRHEIAELQNKLLSSQGETKRTETELYKAKAAHQQELQSLQKRMSELKVVNDQLSSQLIQKESEIAKAKRVPSVATTQRQREVARLAEIESDLSTAWQQREKTRAALDQLKRGTDVKRRKKALEGWGYRLRTLQEQLSTAEDSNQIQFLQAESEIATKKMQDLERSLPEVNTMLQRLEEEYSTLDEQVDSLTAAKDFHLSKLKGSLRARSATPLASTSPTRESIGKEARDYEHQLEEQRGTIQELTAQLQQQKALVAQLLHTNTHR